MMRGEFEVPDIEKDTIESLEDKNEIVETTEIEISSPVMLMNGPNPFFHPITNVLVGPYQYYEGYAHQEHENVPEEEPEKKKRTKKEGA